MVPADWHRKDVHEMKGKVLRCKGCGAVGTGWHHLVFECSGHGRERLDLFHAYKGITAEDPVCVEDFSHPGEDSRTRGKGKHSKNMERTHKIKEAFCIFTSDTVYSEARVDIEELDDGSDSEADSDEEQEEKKAVGKRSEGLAPWQSR